MLRLGWVRVAAAITGYGTKRSGYNRLGKWPLRKLHIWEVANWKNTLEKFQLGKFKLHVLKIIMLGAQKDATDSCMILGYINWVHK